MPKVLFVLLCLVGLLSSRCSGDASNGRGDQPLAQINIYKASLALDTSVHIHASPQVLGLKVLFYIQFFSILSDSSIHLYI